MSNDLPGLCAKKLRDAFAPLLPRGTPVALVGFPETPNCGDHAIWLGEKKLLSELGAKLAYECSAESYARGEMEKKLGEGTVLLHGNANSYGRNAANLAFQARVLADFPGHAAIAFPAQPEIAGDGDPPFGKHGHLTLFAASQAAKDGLARRYGAGARIEIAPDPAFLLGAQKRAADPLYDIVWIARSDGDKANDGTEIAARLSTQAAEKFPMPPLPDGVEMSFVAKHRPPTILLTDWQALVYENELARLAVRRLPRDAWAGVFLARAVYLLSLGHLVVTDRLHGHVLCLLLRIPHLLLNDGSGRNWNFHESWTKPSPLCRLAGDPAEAWSLARHAVSQLKEMPPAEAERWSWRNLKAVAG